MKIGYNLSTEINRENLNNVIKDECNFIQVFTSDPCSFNIFNKNNKQFNSELLLYYKEKRNINYVIHGSFLINLCRLPTDKITINSINLLKKDLSISNKIKALGVIIHMGKDTGKLGYDNALNMYIANLNKVLSETNGIIILETGAGCGTEVGTRLNELGKIRDSCIQKDRVKFCIDTCHIYSAGYDISDPLISNTLESYIENTLGWDNVVIAHVNDSKECINSKKDRHADISKGDISKSDINTFMEFLYNFKKRDIPLVLETPADELNFKFQIDLIKNHFNRIDNLKN